jgi:cation:H+ antiporter
MMYLLLLLGFVLLIKGADFFVDGSSSVARLLGVPSVIIGLTIVAMGTSAPEAAVSITAGLAGSNAIAVSNVIGSNMFNLLMVAGFCAAIRPFALDDQLLKRDFPVNLAANILLVIYLLNGILNRWEGLVTLALFAAYLSYLVMGALKNRQTEEEVKALSPLLSAVYILGGLVAIVYGGDLVVDNAVLIAQHWGLSETFIGLTIIAMGTSLPELVTSIVAARKGESGLALGNVVGSNIFNLMLILGLSSSLSPIPVDKSALVNVILLFAVTFTMFLICKAKREMNRPLGIACIATYAAYTVYLVMMV